MMISHPVGESGMRFTFALGFFKSLIVASATSFRLYGRQSDDSVYPIPFEPFNNTTGNFAGNVIGSTSESSWFGFIFTFPSNSSSITSITNLDILTFQYLPAAASLPPVGYVPQFPCAVNNGILLLKGCANNATTSFIPTLP